MIKRCFFLLIFVLHISFSLAESRREKLSNLNQQIEAQKEKIKQLKYEQKKAQNTKRDYSHKLDWSLKQLKKLEKQKTEYTSKLQNSLKNINKTEANLTDYQKKCLLNIKHLLKLETYQRIYGEENPDKKYLLSLLEITNNEISELEERKDDLLQKKNQFENHLNRISNNQDKENKNKNWAKNRINYYSKKIDETENQRNYFNQTLSQLQAKAKAMKELIAQLDIIENSHQYSYKFSDDKLIWPIKGKIVKKYGTHKFSNKTSLRNTGIDIEANSNSKVVAVDDGVVAFSKWEKDIGKIVIIDHQNGYISSYSYPTKLLVLKGEKVKKNQPIAITGDKTKGHSVIHFELRKDGHPVNPMDFLE